MSILRRLFFNFRYFGKPPWDTGISPPELMGFIQSHPAGHALDLGCGTATNAITLAKHGWHVTGIDFSPRAIRKGRQKVRQASVQVELKLEDVTRLTSLQDPFDLILDIGCFHSLPPPEHRLYLANIQRLLAQDGTYLIYLILKGDPTIKGPGITETDLEALQSRFKVLSKTRGVDRRERPSAWLAMQKL
jgi:cyclopropane fatty-acyl-phospholipid synthase-like methyltransferase